MKTSDFDYTLPEELIAQEPHVPRDECKMLVLDKTSGLVQDKHFFDIYDCLEPGDLLVVNETRVIPARLIGHKRDSGGKAEILLLNRENDVWEALVKPGKRLKPGNIIDFNDECSCEIVDCTNRGTRLVKLHGDDVVHKIGKTPLPPYIHNYTGNMEMYQTVYSANESSAAAPTAGLHFTNELLDKIKNKGVNLETVELEVGIDTFKPVCVDDPEDHVIHSERFSISQKTIDKIKETKDNNHRVIAVGTTSVRTLESTYSSEIKPHNRSTTSLFILPGYKFKVVDAMITNFHIPKSTLMMLVSAFAGRENILNAYKHALKNDYRFLSFGDAMFIK